MNGYLLQAEKEDIGKEKNVWRSFYKVVKRLQDIIFSLCGIVVLSPVLLVISLIIVIDDPQGGPIFSQIRCGKNGKPFKMYKFRTMCVDAEKKLDSLLEKNEMDGPVFKIADDPRITGIGKFLRKTSLDELPQLVNVLKGDMSLVGPRPPLPREVEKYTEYQHHRLDIKSGVTCYWQIQPDRNGLTFDEWVELDMKYIREQGYITDWKIIFMTIKTVFKRQGL